MATIQTLIERVQERISILSGLGVQIHEEGALIEFLRLVYNEVWDDHWNENHTYFRTETLDGTTGQITGSLTTLVRSFEDLGAVFYNSDDDPLPQINKNVNPTKIQRRCIGPNDNPSKVFTVYPVDTAGDVHFWYRTRVDPAVWTDGSYDTDLVLDEEVLLRGTIAMYLADEGSNQDNLQTWRGMYQARLRKLREKTWSKPIPKRPLEHDGVMTRWYV